jgi:hypothetical protein
VVCTATDEDGKTASASQGLSLAVADAKPSISGPTEDLAVDVGINGQFIFDFGADGPSERIVYFTAPCEATLFHDDERGSVFFDDNELEMWFYSSGWYTAEQDKTTTGWHTFIFYIVDADGSEAEHKIVVETLEIG